MHQSKTRPLGTRAGRTSCGAGLAIAWVVSWMALTAMSPWTARGANPTVDFLIAGRHFSTLGGGPYLFLDPGYQLILEGVDEEGEPASITVTALNETRLITLPSGEAGDGEGDNRILTRIVEEREYVADELVDISRFSYARCIETGDIYQFGEWKARVDDNDELSEEEAVWEAGVNGARPGIVMPGTFMVGARYVQGAARDYAISHAENIAMGLTVETPAGTFQNCVKVQEFDPIEADDLPGGEPSIKLYAPGVGMVGDEALRLREINLGVTEALPAEFRFIPFSDHPYLPIIPGRQLELEGPVEGGLAKRTVTVLPDTREIALPVDGGEPRSITARVVEERESIDEHLRVLARSFLAQCVETGDVYLFGREVIYDADDGGPASADASWLAGVHSAQPAMVMPARFTEGAAYIGEPGPSDAMTRAQLLDRCVSVSVPAGTFNDCIRIEERNEETGAVPTVKTYARSIGLLSDGATMHLAKVIRPELETAARLWIEDAVMLSWPTGETNWELQTAGDLETWRPVLATPAFQNGRLWLTLARDDQERFFRLAPKGSE